MGPRLMPRWGRRAFGWTAALLAGTAFAVTAAADPPKPATPPPADVPKSPFEPAKPSPGQPETRAAVTPQTELINKHLADAWKANSLTPSRKATDAEFIRRVTLDII